MGISFLSLTRGARVVLGTSFDELEDLYKKKKNKKM